MSCFSQSSNDQVASKVMLSDVEGQKVVSPASVQPSGNRHIRPWVVVAAIAVACVVIGVAVGVPVGLAVNKNSKQSSPQQVPMLLRASRGRRECAFSLMNTQCPPACTAELRASPGCQHIGPVASFARRYYGCGQCPQRCFQALGRPTRPCCAPPNCSNVRDARTCRFPVGHGWTVRYVAVTAALHCLTCTI